MNSSSWFVIVNPASGSGKTRGRWKKIKHELIAAGIRFEFGLTQYSGEEASLAASAVTKGFQKIIVVGGDGTMQKVVSGVYSQGKVAPKNILIGVIPSGTGNDWIRTHKIPSDYKRAIKVILNQKTKTQDVGRLTVSGGKTSSVVFINYSGMGFDCFVLSRLDQYKRFGPLSYFFCAIMNFLKYRNISLRIQLDEKVISTNIFLLGIGLCSFTGGGMRLAKDANPNNGLFCVTVAENFTKMDVVRNIPKLFNGGIFQDKKVSTHLSSSVRVSCEKNDIVSQADGEILPEGALYYQIERDGLTFCAP